MTIDHPMAKVSAGLPTISAKIRALHAEGYSRSEIARFLQRHPTQVRNVIKADEIRHGRSVTAPAREVAATNEPEPAVEAISDDLEEVFRFKIDSEGRITLPPRALRTLGVREGSIVMGRLEQDALILDSTQATVRRLQAWARSILPEGAGMVDELIHERREEARREAEGD